MTSPTVKLGRIAGRIVARIAELFEPPSVTVTRQAADLALMDAQRLELDRRNASGPTDRAVLEQLVALWLAGAVEQRRAVFAAFPGFWRAMTRADLHLDMTAGAFTGDQEHAIEQPNRITEV